MLICPKCSFIAGIDSAGRILCSNSNCNWSDSVDKISNNLIRPEKVDDEKDSDVESSTTLRWYWVEYIGKDNELFQARGIYDLIRKILIQDNEFAPFVEKCYESFSKSTDSEVVQFYNYFSGYTISKISEFEDLNVVYVEQR